MPKRRLKEEVRILEDQIIETLLAGHKEWRPDLSYPESHSDMQGDTIETVEVGDYENLLAMYREVKGKYDWLRKG